MCIELTLSKLTELFKVSRDYHLIWDYKGDSYPIMTTKYKTEIKNFILNTEVTEGNFRVK